jgi:hypothetical protein
MASTLKVTNISTPDGTGNITVDRPLSGSGASLTSLSATALASGTVPTARLGSGTASSSTFLRGDSTYATVSAGADTDLSNLSSTGKNAVARVWVQFNGSSTVADSFNCSSVTDNGVGDYTVNFAITMGNTYYYSNFHCSDANTNASLVNGHIWGDVSGGRSTTAERVLSQYVSGSAVDTSTCTYICFGD